MVVTTAPCACAAGTRHDITAAPSSQTVHAPHSPSAQPSLAPVKPAFSRSASSSVLCCASSSVRAPAVDRGLDRAGEARRGRARRGRLEQYRALGEALGLAAVGDPLQPARHQRRQRLQPVVGRAAQVADRRGVGAGAPAGLGAGRGVEPGAAQEVLGLARAHHGRREAAQRDARLAHAAVGGQLDDDRQVDHRDRLRAPQAQLQEDAPPRGPQRAEADLAHQLVGAQHRAADAGGEVAQRRRSARLRPKPARARPPAPRAARPCRWRARRSPRFRRSSRACESAARPPRRTPAPAAASPSGRTARRARRCGSPDRPARSYRRRGGRTSARAVRRCRSGSRSAAARAAARPARPFRPRPPARPHLAPRARSAPRQARPAE